MNSPSLLPPAPADSVPRFPEPAARPVAMPYASIVLLYESFATAVRGKAFCDQLLGELGVHCDFDESLWRADLLASPAIRHEVARSALKADFVVLSLRGDAELPVAIEHWCAQWMPQARERDITFIVVFDPATAQRVPMENVRSHLRKAAFAAGVHFFAHAVLAGGDVSRDREDDSSHIIEIPGIASRFARRAQPRPGIDLRRPVTVLVVDDYPVLCDVVSRQLSDAGYRTLKAYDGLEAKQVIGVHGPEIDLVLTDIEMPRMRGDELAVWIQREHPETPVLLMSSVRPRCPGTQGLPVLDKPFRMEALVAAVQEILGHAVAA